MTKHDGTMIREEALFPGFRVERIDAAGGTSFRDTIRW